jgi:sporulation protein YlmC with PRC-barrel domain
MVSAQQAARLLRHGEVVGIDGQPIGKVGQVFVDDSTGTVTWVTVKTGWFGSRESFVPLDRATTDGDVITVPYDKATVKGAPHHESDAALTVADENGLYEYYGVGTAGDSDIAPTDGPATPVAPQPVQQEQVSRVAQSQQVSADPPRVQQEQVPADPQPVAHQQPTPDPRPAGTADGSVLRSEERLTVGTRTEATSRARLRKYLVTEEQTVTVPVRREEVEAVVTDADGHTHVVGGGDTDGTPSAAPAPHRPADRTESAEEQT